MLVSQTLDTSCFIATCQQTCSLPLQLTAPPRAALAKAARRHAPDTAGKDWFDLPAQTLTEDVKRDLRLLRLRGTFDPKRHYKSFDHKKFPRHFQIGTVVESAADFHSGQMCDLKGCTEQQQCLGHQGRTAPGRVFGCIVHHVTGPLLTSLGWAAGGSQHFVTLVQAVWPRSSARGR